MFRVEKAPIQNPRTSRLTMSWNFPRAAFYFARTVGGSEARLSADEPASGICAYTVGSFVKHVGSILSGGTVCAAVTG